MSDLPPTSAASRFANLMAVLQYALKGSRARVRPGWHGPILTVLWNRVSRFARLFAALAARVEAGKYRFRPRPAAATRPVRPPSPDGSGPGGSGPAPADLGALPPPIVYPPNKPGWLIAVTQDAAGCALLLRGMNEDPEMLALLEAGSPQFGRILRPLYRMLDVALPACLIAPKRPRRKRPARPPSPPKEPKPLKQLYGRALARYVARPLYPVWGAPPPRKKA